MNLKRSEHYTPAGVRCVWLCLDLETICKRLKALKAKSVWEGLVLTKDQVLAVERAKDEKQTYGEIESHHLDILESLHLYFFSSTFSK